MFSEIITGLARLGCKDNRANTLKQSIERLFHFVVEFWLFGEVEAILIISIDCSIENV